MTTKPKKTPQAKTQTSAVPQTFATAIQPLPASEGWQKQTAFGFMKSGDTPEGRLVRLADVLRWLETSKELPRSAALDSLCDAMPANILQWCYQLHQTDYAQPLPMDCLFGFRTAEQLDAAKAKRDNEARYAAMRPGWVTSWDGAPSRPVALRVVVARALAAPAEPTTPGLPALTKLLRQWWNRAKLRRDSTCDVLDDPKAALPGSLAIRLDKAAELWGYGTAARPVEVAVQPLTWRELVDHRKQRPRETWTPAMLELLAAEKAARGSGAAASIAGELSISVSALNQVLALHRKRPQASPVGRVVRFQ